MEEKGPHIYRVMNCSDHYYTTSPFTNRETDAQGGQSWALETGLPVPGTQVSSTARLHHHFLRVGPDLCLFGQEDTLPNNGVKLALVLNFRILSLVQTWQH